MDFSPINFLKEVVIMNIQSLSVVVPNTGCINNCAFCVSKMHPDQYKNQMDDNLPFFDLYMKDYLKRLEFARHNGCNTVMLTGNSEPQQNRKFLTYFGMFMQLMSDPFQWIEMQTTGVLLDQNYLRFLRNHVGVNLISLSICSPNTDRNFNIIGCSDAVVRNSLPLKKLCSEIKRYDFSLRLSLNMTSDFHKFSNPKDLYKWAASLGADQVTLRILYTSGDNVQSKWIDEHAARSSFIDDIVTYTKAAGTLLGVLPYGAHRYSINGLSVVVDTDCMSKNMEIKMKLENAYKYLILQPNCKLYSQWDDPASLIF